MNMPLRSGSCSFSNTKSDVSGRNCKAFIPALRSRSLRQQAHRHSSLLVYALRKTSKSSAPQKKAQHNNLNKNGSKPAAARASQDNEDENVIAKFAAPLGLAAGLGLIIGGGYLYKDELRGYIDYFIQVADQLGPAGYVAYGGLYTLLEIFAVPAIPLTMTAGILFGRLPGIVVVSGASTLAATLAFLIARYAARDKVRELAEKNNKFKAVDKAIGKNSFKVVTLLRLSPLLPLALSNYFYGLTSVDLGSYVAGSWLGMLPGTILYVIAGDYGRDIIDNQEDMGLPLNKWQVGAGILLTLAILGYIGRLAKNALDDAEAEEAA